MKTSAIHLLASSFLLFTLTACSSTVQTPSAQPQNSSSAQTVPQQVTPSTSTPESEPNPPVAQQPSTPLPPAAKEEGPASTYYINSKNYNIYSTQKEDHRKLALLTFDDGPKGIVTTKILDILDKYHAKSIWFINGYNYGSNYKPSPQKEERFISLVKEIQKRGHIIGNHTWEHDNLRKLPVDKQRQEIISMNQLLEPITKQKITFFRPPFGAYTDTSNEIIKEEHMQSINWSVGSLDWELKKPEQVVKQVITTMHSGGNILMHDLPITSQALDSILKQLTAEGYQFVLPTEIADK